MCLYTRVSDYCHNKMFLQSPFKRTPFRLGLLEHCPPLEQPIRECVGIRIAAQTAAVHVFLRDTWSRINTLPVFGLGYTQTHTKSKRAHYNRLWKTNLAKEMTI